MEFHRQKIITYMLLIVSCIILITTFSIIVYNYNDKISKSSKVSNYNTEILEDIVKDYG